MSKPRTINDYCATVFLHRYHKDNPSKTAERIDIVVRIPEEAAKILFAQDDVRQLHDPLSLSYVQRDRFLTSDRLTGIHSLFDQMSVRIGSSHDDHGIHRGMLDRFQAVSHCQLRPVIGRARPTLSLTRSATATT
jgi:hypothetical protein